MDLKIKGKWALITGGANGIGEEISCQLAIEGVHIIATSRSEKPIKNLQQKLAHLNIEVHGIIVDFLEPNWIDDFKKKISKFSISILVNNAGHALNVTDPYCSIEDWHRVMELNFYTAVNLCNLLIPNMKDNQWGRIINITSCAGLENSGPVTYSVSKSSLTVYTRTMGRILATEGGHVVMSAIYPGVVQTEGGHWDSVLKTNPSHAKKYLEERTPLKRFGSVSEIAPVVVFQCSDLASFSHGAIISVDGGQSRHYSSFNYLS
jgi:3-oxoacyl-[acyl-carrier protein] reductase